MDFIGIHTIRVDGNDLFAVYVAVKEARKIALQNKPVSAYYLNI